MPSRELTGSQKLARKSASVNSRRAPSMGSLLGFRPPQFSEDAAWLPSWLQQLHVQQMDECMKEAETPEQMCFKESLLIQKNIPTGDMYLPLKDDARYKSCHLFLSGEDSSPVSSIPSSGNIVPFPLHLSFHSNSKNISTPSMDTYQAGTLDSKHAQLMLPLKSPLVAGKKANKLKMACSSGVENFHPPTHHLEISKYSGHQSLVTNCNKEFKPKENARISQVSDINDAVELSVAASEALVIHEVTRRDSSAKALPPAAVLEAALHMKQARLEVLGEIFDCLTDEISEMDSLSDLDESTMAEAYEDVGLSVTYCGGPQCMHLSPSQVQDTFSPETQEFEETVKLEKHGGLISDSADVSTNKWLKNCSSIDVPLRKEKVESLNDRQKEINTGPGPSVDTTNVKCYINRLAHHNIQADPNVPAITEKVDTAMMDGMVSFKATVDSSHVGRSFENAERVDKETEKAPARTSALQLAGCTLKREIKSSAPGHNDATTIPPLFVGETSFLSESAYVVPDENSFVPNCEKSSNIASQSNIPLEGSVNKANEEILLSPDIVRSSGQSLIDPLCSVVPCSISTENACSSSADHNDQVDSGTCFTTRPEVKDNLPRTSPPNFELVHMDGPAPLETNHEGSHQVVRKQITSLRTYSMLLPNNSDILEKTTSFGPPSLPAEHSSVSSPCAMQDPMSDKASKDGPRIILDMEKKGNSSICVSRGSVCRVQILKRFLQNFSRRKNPEPAGLTGELPRSHILLEEKPQCMNSNDKHGQPRKRVRFLETATDFLQKKAKKQQILKKNCSSTGVGKRLRGAKTHLKTRGREEKIHLAACSNKTIKTRLFRNLEFLLTGFSSQKDRDIEGFIREYGGVVLKDIPSPPTSRRKRSSRLMHQPLPIVLCSKKLETTKFLYGCAVNAHILEVKWLTDSIAAGSVLPPEEYMILPNHNDEKCNKIGKSICQSYHIFDGTGIMLHGKHKFCTRMTKIVKHGGGQVFKTLQWLIQSLDAERISVGVIVAEDEFRASRHLKHCALEKQIPLMPISWIIKSLHAGSLIPFVQKNHSSQLPLIKHAVSPPLLEFSEEI